jgi:hypothetical protein
MPGDDVLQLRHLRVVRRRERKIQHAIIGNEAALAHVEHNPPGPLVERDGALVREMLAELLQVAAGVRCSGFGDTSAGATDGDLLVHRLRSTACAAASSAAAMCSAAA